MHLLKVVNKAKSAGLKWQEDALINLQILLKAMLLHVVIIETEAI